MEHSLHYSAVKQRQVAKEDYLSQAPTSVLLLSRTNLNFLWCHSMRCRHCLLQLFRIPHSNPTSQQVLIAAHSSAATFLIEATPVNVHCSRCAFHPLIL